jgi:hypothetical protein
VEERILMKVNDLEDKIMGVWSTCEDIDTFLYRYSDSPAGEMSEDDITNTLLGIKTLHEQRCQRLWDAFEQVLANSIPPEKPGFDSNGIRYRWHYLPDDAEKEPARSVPDDSQRRRDSMGLEGLRSG